MEAFKSHQRLHAEIAPSSSSLIHSYKTNSQFLEWHRWWLWEAENILRKVHPCVTIPYWDWEMEAANWQASDIWQNEDTWFGGNGEASDSNCVHTGPFAKNTWADADGVCLQREFRGLGMPDVTDLQYLNNSPEAWLQFFWRLNNDHGAVHSRIRGTMVRWTSTYAPEFLLHHANVDRLWETYQR